ncbi:hypothetical protein KC19_VG008400 [Ceratodon purpureus]|uniref:Uncharacterized protein n=1 Tax=Ceratodon purpureus TaxID=3225 RepID=A0A8T0HKS5_CERPU|nr:hypothetical protein KC19_VG008400 [Ceratodon purpureus]
MKIGKKEKKTQLFFKTRAQTRHSLKLISYDNIPISPRMSCEERHQSRRRDNLTDNITQEVTDYIGNILIERRENLYKTSVCVTEEKISKPTHNYQIILSPISTVENFGVVESRMYDECGSFGRQKRPYSLLQS